MREYKTVAKKEIGSGMFLADEPPELPIRLLKLPRRKVARARIRGAAIEIVVPKHWPGAFKADAAQQLAHRLQNQFTRDWELLHASNERLLSFVSREEFEQWVRQLNRKTLQAPLNGVRIGYSRYTHLAQMNLKTQIMTVSRHCLDQVPESALHYLVIHELTHLRIASHSKLFWNEVRRFVPEYKHQRRLIAATHRIRLYQAEVAKGNSSSEPLHSPEPLPLLQRIREFARYWERP